MCYDPFIEETLKGITLYQLLCHLLEGPSHLSVEDKLIMKCINEVS